MTINNVKTPIGIHHINYVVRDLSASVAYFEALLEQTATYEDLPTRQVSTARFLLGPSYLVLVCPSTEDSEVGKVLAERGEGLFLLSLSTNDLGLATQSLKEKGINLTSAGSRKGLLNWQVADLDAPKALGPILQICQADKADK